MVDQEITLVDVDTRVVVGDHFPSEIALANVASLGINARCFRMTIVGQSSRNTALVEINTVSSLRGVLISWIVDVASIALASETAVIIVALRIFMAVVRFAITLVDVDAIISVVVELVSSVADALVGPESIAASSVCWTIVSISIALVDVFTDEPVSHVLESGPAFASERTRVIGAIRLRTARSVFDAFIDVVAVAVHSVASPADIAVTLVAADVIGASSVDIAIMVVE
jgi:hypothetical protein